MFYPFTSFLNSCALIFALSHAATSLLFLGYVVNLCEATCQSHEIG